MRHEIGEYFKKLVGRKMRRYQFLLLRHNLFLYHRINCKISHFIHGNSPKEKLWKKCQFQIMWRLNVWNQLEIAPFGLWIMPTSLPPHKPWCHVWHYFSKLAPMGCWRLELRSICAVACTLDISALMSICWYRIILWSAKFRVPSCDSASSESVHCSKPSSESFQTICAHCLCQNQQTWTSGELWHLEMSTWMYLGSTLFREPQNSSCFGCFRETDQASIRYLHDLIQSLHDQCRHCIDAASNSHARPLRQFSFGH